jgi:hypothetical protein
MEILEHASQFCWGMGWGVMSQWCHVDMGVLFILTVSAPALLIVLNLLLMSEDIFFHLLELFLLALNL